MHYNNPEMGGGSGYVVTGSFNYYLLHVIHSISVCAVDTFLIIVGYYMCTKKVRYAYKPILLLLKCSLLSGVAYMVMTAFGIKEFSIKSLIGNFIPANYFLILYITLYMISPYINIVLERLELKNFKIFLLIMVVLFSVLPTLLDQFNGMMGKDYNGLSTIGLYGGSQQGYSIVNFIMCYIVGATLKKYEKSFKNYKIWLILMVLGASITIITIWDLMNVNINLIQGNPASEYCNPILILEGASFFILFHRIHIGENWLINQATKEIFTFFILHGNFLVLLDIENACKSSWIYLIGNITGSAMLILLICSLIGITYNHITRPITKWLHQIAGKELFTDL